MPPVSVAICCGNAVRTIEAACLSAAWADQIVIVDSESTDGTADIARRYAETFVVEPWRGYTEQKRFAVSLCRNDWVLVLDADEECSAELAEEIQGLQQQDLGLCDVFHIPRRNYLFGRQVRAWTDDQSRLIHRHRCRWRDAVLHDDRVPSEPSRQRRLQGHLRHNCTSGLSGEEYWQLPLIPAHVELVARDMRARGRRCRWHDLFFRPKFDFLKSLLLKGGLWQGRFGLEIARQAAHVVRVKYLALALLEHRDRLTRAAAGRPADAEFVATDAEPGAPSRRAA